MAREFLHTIDSDRPQPERSQRQRFTKGRYVKCVNTA